MRRQISGFLAMLIMAAALENSFAGESVPASGGYSYDVTIYTYNDEGVAVSAETFDGDYDTASEARDACQADYDQAVQDCESFGGSIEDVANDCSESFQPVDLSTGGLLGPTYAYGFFCELPGEFGGDEEVEEPIDEGLADDEEIEEPIDEEVIESEE